jgi:hypothetical protein
MAGAQTLAREASGPSLHESAACRRLGLCGRGWWSWGLAVGGLEMAARYVPGTGNVGGDWYDVFPLPGGEV